MNSGPTRGKMGNSGKLILDEYADIGNSRLMAFPSRYSSAVQQIEANRGKQCLEAPVAAQPVSFVAW